MAQEADNDFDKTATRWSILVIVLLGSLGIVCILAFSFTAESVRLGLSAFTTILLVAGASLVVGSVTGFLFAIPRTLRQPGGGPEPQSKDDLDEALKISESGYAHNTNLEEVSDWLTKILLGVGLTQLSTIPHLLNKLGETVSNGISDLPNAASVTSLSCVYFAGFGFLAGYILTRLHLPVALSRTDQLLSAAHRKIRRLEDLNLDLDGLQDYDLVVLKKIVDDYENKREYVLPRTFQKESPEHNSLRRLRARSLIRASEGRGFRTERHVELTPVAIEQLELVKKKLEKQASEE